jgi:hypothetical protein
MSTVNLQSLGYFRTNALSRFRWAVCQLDSLQRLKPDRQTVRKALKNLPKTLDESYDRIFIRIPEEDRLFFYHALHWISYHQEQHSWNIPCSILLQAAARSTTEINDSQRDLYLDKNILKEVLGRLITITSEKQHSGDIEVDTVTFSHYTVREYLDSSRILKAKTSAVAYRQGLEERFLKLVFREALHGVPNELWNKVDYSLELSDLHAAVKVDPEDYIKLDNINDVFTLNGNLKKEFLGVPFSESATKLFKETFRYPNVLKIYEHWKEHIGSIPKPDIHSAIQQSFNTYAMLSAIHCLYDGQAKLGQYDGLDTLAFAFLTPFQKHYSTLCTAANIMESKVGILDDDSWYGDDRFWHVRWLLDSGNTDVVVLFSLLLLSMYSQRNLILAKRFLSRIELNKVLNIPLIIQKKTWDPDLFRKGWYFYAGTLPDILAQLMMEDTTPFRLLLDDAQEHFNLSRALISYIGSHDHDVLSDDRKDCPLERLLELGADFSGSGYKVTPLQIAVHCWSIEAVDLLLKAGADPNGVGEVDGTAWMPGTYLARFNALHGATPLYICRVFDCTFKDDKMSKRKANRELIEASLVKYNAEASIKQ